MKRNSVYLIACAWFGIAVSICGIYVTDWEFWLIVLSGHALAWTIPKHSAESEG